MPTRRLHPRDAAGFALVEVLVAVVIMATATVTLGGVLVSLFTLTAENRGAASTDGALRSYAEAVQQKATQATASSYVPCPSAAALTPTSAPSGVTANALAVDYWIPAAGGGGAFVSGSTGRDQCFSYYNRQCLTFGMAGCTLDSSSTAPLADLCPPCDPGLVRVTVSVTDSADAHGSVTNATQIFLRRSNVGGTS